MFKNKIPNQSYMKPDVLLSHISKTVGYDLSNQKSTENMMAILFLYGWCF